MPLNLLYECFAFKLRKESRYLLSTEIYIKRSKLMFSNLEYTLSVLKFFLHFLMVPTFQYFGWVFFCLFVCLLRIVLVSLLHNYEEEGVFCKTARNCRS